MRKFKRLLLASLLIPILPVFMSFNSQSPGCEYVIYHQAGAGKIIVFTVPSSQAAAAHEAHNDHVVEVCPE